MIRRLENFVSKYGPEASPVLNHLLRSQAAHAGVSKRPPRKLDVLEGRAQASVKMRPLPLFPNIETEEAVGASEPVAASNRTVKWLPVVVGSLEPGSSRPGGFEPIKRLCFASPPPQKLMLSGGLTARHCIPLRAAGEAHTTEAG